MSLFAKNNRIVADPVCGMAVDPKTTRISAEIEGEAYYFCAESCRKSFLKNPQEFLCPRPARKKGIWGRYLSRLEKSSGGRPMKCH